MANGFQQLGFLLGGGGQMAEEEAYDREIQRRSRAEEALQKARVARAEAMGREKALAATGEEMLGDAMLGALAAGRMGNYEQLMSGRLRRQEYGFRDTIADPATAMPARQYAAQAIEGKPTAYLEGVGAGGFQDIRAPDVGVRSTPLGESLIEENTAAARESRADAIAALAKAALDQSKIPRTGVSPPAAAPALGDALTPSDPSQAFGIVPGLQSGANTIVDALFGVQPFEDVAEARVGMQRLADDTRIVLSQQVPGKPSNYMLEIMGRYVADPSAFTGEEGAQQAVTATLAGINEVESELARMLAGPLTPSNRDKINNALGQMRALKQRYQVVLQNFQSPGTGRGGAEGRAPIESFIRRGSDAATSLGDLVTGAGQ